MRGKKQKALYEELGSAKKKKEELESAAKKLIDTAAQKARGLEQKDVTQMKALLVESNASREKSKKLKKSDMPTQEKKIQYLQKTVEGAGLIRVYLVKDMQVLQNVVYLYCKLAILGGGLNGSTL